LIKATQLYSGRRGHSVAQAGPDQALVGEQGDLFTAQLANLPLQSRERAGTMVDHLGGKELANLLDHL